ncbi:hypothetical protein F5X68DRAFT_270196 [Plectosphaerella plurivora]|uniref:Diphthine methyltransferase n=1 Tax=Plectosphaerella plurivora TaxID=936078 RepID=A0A9P8V5R0_9PEZI|nr:hypothetical protein F5X68DRAFT_270196 [Plectosphaerella plurivora]
MEGLSLSSQDSILLDLPPCCVEFCPEAPSYFIVGTYNLVKDESTTDDNVPSSSGESAEPRSTQSRHGTLIVFEVTDGHLEQRQVAAQPSAILDIHFCPVPGLRNVLAVASSTGTVSFFRFGDDGNQARTLQHLNTSSVPGIESSLLFTSIAWHPDDAKVLSVTVSSGEVLVLRLDEQWNILSSQVAITHTLEAWTVVFSPTLLSDDSSSGGRGDGSRVELYSGGDDSTLRYTSMESTEDDMRPMYPAVQVSGHTAGVTAVIPTTFVLDDGYDVVITGSYDDHIRIFAIQKLSMSFGARKARLLAEKNLGGGVWRLKLITVESNAPDHWSALVLVCCMHAGSRIARISGQQQTSLDWDWDIQVLGRFEEHQSMNYGSDFMPSTAPNPRGLVCVSTSFYDKALCLWTIDLESK